MKKISNPKTILFPIPLTDFDPTETAISWEILSTAGHKIIFATPTGEQALADQRMIVGDKLGIFKPFLIAKVNAIESYKRMEQDNSFKNPIKYTNLDEKEYDAILLPGGHAPGMKPYLESSILQNLIVEFFEKNKPVAAICHGVVLASRSISKQTGKSVLYGKKTTALLESSELLAWKLTKSKIGNYYRTYTETVESEVKKSLKTNSDFLKGPMVLFRDSYKNVKRGFVVRDGNYLSARWPGDVHNFAITFLEMLKE